MTNLLNILNELLGGLPIEIQDTLLLALKQSINEASESAANNK